MNESSIGAHSRQPTFSRIISMLERKLRKEPKLKPLPTAFDDAVFYERIAHCLKKGEKPAELVVRSNFRITPESASRMTAAEISEAVERGERAVTEAGLHAALFKAPALPQKFFIDSEEHD